MEPRSEALEADAFTTRPTRRCLPGKDLTYISVSGEARSWDTPLSLSRTVGGLHQGTDDSVNMHASRFPPHTRKQSLTPPQDVRFAGSGLERFWQCESAGVSFARGKLRRDTLSYTLWFSRLASVSGTRVSVAPYSHSVCCVNTARSSTLPLSPIHPPTRLERFNSYYRRGGGGGNSVHGGEGEEGKEGEARLEVEGGCSMRGSVRCRQSKTMIDLERHGQKQGQKHGQG